MSMLLDQVLNKVNKKVYVIAEIGSNFNGDLQLAKQSINAAVECGADAVKFQTFKAEEFVADKALTFTYQTLSGEEVTESQFDMFKRLELRDEWHKELLDHSSMQGVDFFSSAADKNAADLLIKLKVPIIKLASEDLINVSLLEYIASKKYPVMLSTGMADEFEIRNAIEIFKNHGSDRLVILHCVSQYPTPLENASLSRITALIKNFNFPIGYSDHTEGWQAPMQSVAYGARVIEKHFTLDKGLPGPDHKMAADPNELKELIKMIRLAESMAGNTTLSYHPEEEQGRDEYRRSIVAAVDINKGTVIKEEMLAYKRPGYGLKPYQRDLVIGKKLLKDISENERILQPHLEI